MSIINVSNENKNRVIAAIIFLVLSLWLLSGVLSTSEKNNSDPSENTVTSESTNRKTLDRELEQQTVRAQWYEAKSYARQILVKSRTEPLRRVLMRSEIFGRITSLPQDRGDWVSHGDVICEIATDDRAARLDDARARLASAQIDYQGAKRLENDGYQSQAAIASAKAALNSAKLSVAQAQLDMDRRNIRAPFDGYVNQRPVEVGDYLRVGDTCAEIIELNPLAVIGRVSESQATQFKVGAPAQIRLQNGLIFSGEVAFIEGRADETTRTYEVEIQMENPNAAVKAGASAEVNVTAETVMAHQLPAAVLTLRDDGNVAVKLLGKENEVVLHTVEIVGDGDDGVWVKGLPKDSLVITVGQEYVSVGQTVSVDIASNKEGQQLPSLNKSATENPQKLGVANENY
ncbi:efflux RND transporter periplasmic adaptor subunit [Marinibactrum halimedae]|uniref:Hemolysin D n=1 Tax=Marinibactrum halimedae TaxID=1444977 RepID=A0AA37T1W6_9GAMM|nr:efflux RND transporter periplasmic adaptor subunit [Marinibactrum halimedae]MCD9459901.1 efflux RND transporter periplasmic adaptor subunit [Marinibactrum halimedae]GLS25244.1 hemolysin D [Marinibactrum halimedae]